MYPRGTSRQLARPAPAIHCRVPCGALLLIGPPRVVLQDLVDHSGRHNFGRAIGLFHRYSGGTENASILNRLPRQAKLSVVLPGAHSSRPPAAPVGPRLRFHLATPPGVRRKHIASVSFDCPAHAAKQRQQFRRQPLAQRESVPILLRAELARDTVLLCVATRESVAAARSFSVHPPHICAGVCHRAVSSRVRLFP
jgi:hypothetical protein